MVRSLCDVERLRSPDLIGRPTNDSGTKARLHWDYNRSDTIINLRHSDEFQRSTTIGLMRSNGYKMRSALAVNTIEEREKAVRRCQSLDRGTC